MKIWTSALAILLAPSVGGCSPATAPNRALEPSQCFLVNIDQDGEDELVTSMNRLASANGLTVDRSSPSYIAYLRHDGSYASILSYGPNSTAILTSYDAGNNSLDLASVATSAQHFALRPCPPTSNSFSPPTIYGQ
jgi:hypothetical protein